MTLFRRHSRAILIGFAAAAVGGLLTLGLDDTEATIFAGAGLAAKALIGAGWIAHGFWDAIHHEHHGPTEVKTWYPLSAQRRTWLSAFR